MENTVKVERSELWNQIFKIVNQIPRKQGTEDAVDAQSATTSIENIIKGYKTKAEKWDKLDEEIGKYYEDDEDDIPGSEYDEEGGSLLEIGEAAAIAFGYL